MLNGISGAITAVGGIYDQFADRAATRRANRDAFRNEQWFWRHNNEYNTPLNQRLRLEAGGFNPNLAYGHGSIANTSSPMRSPDVKTPPPSNFGGAIRSGMQAYQDLTMNTEQIEKMDKEKEVMDADIQQKAAQTALATANTSKSEFEVEKARQVLPLSLDALEASVRKTNTDISSAQLGQTKTNLEIKNLPRQQQDAHREVEQRIKESEDRMRTAMQSRANLSQARQKMAAETLIQREIVKMKRLGIEPNDNILARLAGKWLSRTEIREILESGSNNRHEGGRKRN